MMTDTDADPRGWYNDETGQWDKPEPDLPEFVALEQRLAKSNPFGQDRWWYDAQGEPHTLDAMSVRYKRNLLAWLERHAVALEFRDALMALAFSGALGIGEAADDAMSDALEERADDPVAWILDTPLARRLAHDIEHNLGGKDD